MTVSFWTPIDAPKGESLLGLPRTSLSSSISSCSVSSTRMRVQGFSTSPKHSQKVITSLDRQPRSQRYEGYYGNIIILSNCIHQRRFNKFSPIYYKFKCGTKKQLDHCLISAASRVWWWWLFCIMMHQTKIFLFLFLFQMHCQMNIHHRSDVKLSEMSSSCHTFFWGFMNGMQRCLTQFFFPENLHVQYFY